MSKQRPWGWIVWRAMAEPEIERCKPKDGDYVLCEPLYTTPLSRKPLSDERIDQIIASNVTITDPHLLGAVYMAIREVEAAHGIGEA